MALTQTQVSQLYVTLFGRASEGAGNEFWQGASTLVQAATDMLASQPAQDYFGSSLDNNQAFIEHIYLNTLNKTVAQDPDGIAFWVGALDGGMSRGEVAAALIEAVYQYAASTDPVTKAAYDQFTNRVAVSNYCADTISGEGLDASDPAAMAVFTNFITSVTNDPATVTATQIDIDMTANPDSFEASAATVKDGDTIEYTFTTADPAVTEVTYTITGVTANQVVGGASALTGTAAVVNGEATFSVTLLADVVNGANETVSATLAGITSVSPVAVTVVDSSATATNITINAVEIAQATGAIAKSAGDTGTVDYTVSSNHAASLDPTVVISGNANINVTSGSGYDTILVDGNGNNVINSGSGDDTILIDGTGNSVVVIDDGNWNAADSITAGSGNDTIRVSGTNNLTLGTYNNIENLIIESDGVITLTGAQAAGFDTIVVQGTAAELSITTAGTYDLTGILSGSLAVLDLALNVSVALDAEQLANIASVTGLGSISTSIDGAIAAAANDVAVTINVTDSIENIIARGGELSGITIGIADPISVATAEELLAAGLSVAYDLEDTATNLSVAPQAVFDGATSLNVTTIATAAQAVNIDTACDTAGLVAANVTLSVSDTASMLANMDAGIALAGTVTATTAATADEAVVIYAANTDAVFAIADTAANLDTNKADGSFDNATSITVVGAATVAQIQGINTASDVGVTAGYALTDSFANINGASSTTKSRAGNITVSGGAITVANALTIEGYSNTGSNSYVIEDAITTLLAANSAVVSSASAVSTSTANLTAAQMNSLVNKFGTTKLNDANINVQDTAANLLTLSANSVAEANAIAATNNLTVAQYEALIELLDAKMPNVTVSDSYANLAAYAAEFGNLASNGAMPYATVIAVTGTPTVAEVHALNAAARWGATLKVANTYTLNDTVANLAAAAAAGGGADTTNEVLADAASVVVSDAATVAQINSIQSVASLVLGTTLTYSLVDSASNILAGAGTVTGATAVSITDASVTGANATSLVALANFDGVYAIVDTVANISATPTATDDVLNGATSVTLRDTVANLTAGAGVTAMALDTVDMIKAQDTLANLNTASADFKASVDGFVATDAGLDADDAAVVNALAAIAPIVYGIVDAYGDLITSGSPASTAIGTLIAGAATVEISAALTAAQFNVLDALTAATIDADITDTIANLSASTGSAAIAAADAAGATVTISDTDATVAQIVTLDGRGLDVSGLNIVDTAANITAAADAMLGAVSSITVSDNGVTTLSVAGADNVYDAMGMDINGSSYGNYNLVDTAANLAAANANLLNFAASVTATTAASAAQASTLSGRTTMGSMTYSVTDSAANLADAAGAALNSATNITANTAASVAQAVTILAATNSGTTSYAITDTPVNLATSVAASVAAIEEATGTVTANAAVTGAQATTIAGFTKAVVYSIQDTSAGVAASTGLNEAVNITTTNAATAAQANTIMAATNSGATSLSAVTDSAANIKTLVIGANDTITTVTVTGTTSVADATTIAALDTGANIGTLAITAISGTVAQLAAAAPATLGLATIVTATDAMTLAQFAAFNRNVDVYSLTDSYANLMENSNVAGDVDAAAAITGATVVTVTDTSLTVAQAVALTGVAGAPEYVYNIVDNDANIVAAMAATPTVLSGAASVKGYDGIALSFDTAGGTFCITGTKAELDALSDVIQTTADKLYEVSIADLEADSAFYSSLDATQNFRVTDTVANLTGGNALAGVAAALVVSDNATVAQATEITALGVADVTFSLADTAALLAAASGGILNDAVNVTATSAATFAQAELLADATNTGSTTYDISDVDTAFSVDDNADGARNITVTGTTGLSAANAQTLLSATNSGSTTLAKVTGTAAQMAGLSLDANDTITAITATGNSTVAQAEAFSAFAATATYSLSDTAEALAEAASSVLNGATAIAATDSATVAQAIIIDAATASDANTSFQIADTAANILAASTALLAKDGNDVIAVTDTSVTAAVATALRAFDTANTGFTITDNAVGDFTISDTSANLLLAANAAAVAASDVITVTDTISAATANSVISAATGVKTLTYNLSDTYANLAINATATNGASDITVTGQLNVAQAVLAEDWTNGGTLTFNVTDTAAKVATDMSAGAGTAVVDDATVVTLNSAATVAQAGYLSEMTNLAAGYTISDTAANVQAAIDTVNSVNGADRDTVLSAASITLTTSATVDEACGVAGTESRGLYTVDGLQFAITDTGAAMATALAGIDAEGVLDASALYLSGTTGLSIANATSLLALDNFVGHDHDANASTAARYYIEDSATNVAVATTELIDGAYTVVANGTAAADTINLSMFTRGVTILAGAGADTITGTDGGDVITGEANSDVFVFTSGSGDAATQIDIITDFTTTADTLKLGVAGAVANFDTGAVANFDTGDAAANYAAALADANTALNGTVRYYFASAITDLDDLLSAGGAYDGDGALFIDWDLDGSADQAIVIVGGVAGAIVAGDIVL